MSSPDLILSNLRGTGRSSLRLTLGLSAGAPTSGTYTLGELYLDAAGAMWRCTAAGTPGTWTTFGGGVQSVGLTAPGSLFTVSGSPVTSSGTLALTLANAAQNSVWAGPATGGAGAPSYRALAAADIPAHPYTLVTGLATIASTGSASDLVAGTVPAARMPAHTGDVTSTIGTVALTLATLLTAGSAGGANSVPVITYDTKGRLTAVTTAAITPSGIGAEPALGNPAASGYVLSSTIGGARSWIALAAIATSGSGADLAAGSVALSKIANQATATILGNNSGSLNAPSALTSGQVKTLLNIGVGDIAGLGYFATGTSAANLTGTAPVAILPVFSSSTAGVVPASGGGSTNFLRADGSWTAPVFVSGTGTVGTLAKWSSTTGITNSLLSETAPTVTLTAGSLTAGNNTGYYQTATIADFWQYDVKNASSGTGAQSGFSATANTGTSTTGFMWLGINNSGTPLVAQYNIGGALDSSLLSSSNDLYIANSNSAKDIIISTGTGITPWWVERLRIKGSSALILATATVQAQAAATQDAVAIAGRAGGSSSRVATIVPGSLTGSFTYTLPPLAANDSFAMLGLAQTFTGANVFLNAAGILVRQAAAQDAIALVGRAGGTSSFGLTLQPSTLTASRTATFPDASITVAGTNIAQTFNAQQTISATGAALSLINTTTNSNGLTLSIYNDRASNSYALQAWVAGSALGTPYGSIVADSAVIYSPRPINIMSDGANSIVISTGSSGVNQLKLDSSGVLSLNTTTDATSTTAASVVLSGGLGVAKGLIVGGNSKFTTTGNTTLTVSTSAVGPAVVGLQFDSAGTNTWNVGSVAGSTTPKSFFIYDSLNSINALTITPGIISAGGIAVTYTTDATTVNSAALVSNGGLGVAKRSFLGTIGSTFAGNVIAGVQTGAAAVSGQVGEIITATYSGAPPATGTAGNVMSITLTPGDWLVQVFGALRSGGGSLSTGIPQLSLSSTSATHGTVGVNSITNGIPATTSGDLPLSIPGWHVNTASSLTIYVVLTVGYTGSIIFPSTVIATRIR